MAYITEAEYKLLFSIKQFEHYIQRDLATASEATARFNMLAAAADDKMNSILNMRYDTENLPDEDNTLLKLYAGSLINFYAVNLLGNAKEADMTLYNNTVEGLKDFRDSRAEITNSDGEISDEYNSKQVYASGGNIGSYKEVEHLNNNF